MRTRGAGLVIVALATGCHTSPVQPCATAGLSRIAPNPQPPAPIPQLDSIFRAAGAEFHVSPSLLSGIGWVETRWQMVQGAEEFPGRPAAFGVMGLRGEALERGAALAGVTIEAARHDPVANIRLELERGRMFRSSGDPEAAYPLFQDAFARALEADERYLAGDAAHMCAIAVDDRELQEQWTQRGLDEGDPYWAGPLYNNLGVAYSEAGDHARALELFELGLEARLRDPENEQAIEWAREAVEEEKQFLAEA